MKRKLMIVESPNKVHKLKEILGAGWEVVSTAGHIEDLPKHRHNNIGGIGIDVLNGFKLRWTIREDREKTVQFLRARALKADEIYIATDPDREGEAIAYSVSKYLPEGADVKRVTFTAITADAVRKAVGEPRGIDRNLVRAAHARKAVDKLIGVVLSSKATDALNGGVSRDSKDFVYFSVGRVQSPAVAMVCERTYDRLRFTPQEYWEMAVNYDVFGSVGAAGIWLRSKGNAPFHNEGAARAAMSGIKGKVHTIKEVKRTTRKVSPPKALTTAAMQVAAFNNGGIGVSSAMSAAQKLFEKGHITYPRTDSASLSPEGEEIIRDFILQNYGQDYYRFRRHGAGQEFSQEAHECLRPTESIALMQFARDMNYAEKNVYGLIRDRAVAALMADAVVEEIEYIIDAGVQALTAKGERLLFDGFYKVLGAPKMQSIPDVPQGTKLVRHEAALRRKETEPPARHNEATLVESLVEHGMGRPSTYANIIEAVKNRGYVTTSAKEGAVFAARNIKGGFESSEKAENLVLYLAEHHPFVVDKKFTRELEEMLDSVAKGKMPYQKPVETAWKKLQETVPEISSFSPEL